MRVYIRNTEVTNGNPPFGHRSSLTTVKQPKDKLNKGLGSATMLPSLVPGDLRWADPNLEQRLHHTCRHPDTPGGTTPSPPFYYDSDIATAGLANRFMASGDLTTVTITDVTEGDDGAYRCASGSFSYTQTANLRPASTGQKQGDSSFMTTGATLRISDLKTNNTGTYVCTAYHQYASDTASVQLNVSPASLKPGLSTVAIVGIVIGSLAAVALIVTPIVIVLTKPKICYS
ncbi:hypothetical protein Bbelb_190070 [Branchiostoma belcheri]|nr:hypothetical protein Bbelb_190070 [Branchiostoma belcheri]